MKTKLIIPLLLLTGCATMTPRQQLYTAQSAFEAAIDAIEAADVAGHLSAEDSERADVLMLVGEKMLLRWQEAVFSGQQPPETTIEKFDLILAGLEAFLKEIPDE